MQPVDLTKVNAAISRELTEKTNEVARLRGQLTRVLEIAEKFRWYTRTHEWLSMKDELDKIKTEHEARLAPAKEEPTIKESLQVEPEWRELGPDEVICEGDEIYITQKWNKVRITGRKPSEYVFAKFRTRRPLCPNDAPKQEEMPLEKEIFRLQKVGWLTYAEGQQDLTDCLRYLRDEIQKLKQK